MFDKEQELIEEFIRLIAQSNNTILTGFATQAGSGTTIPIKIGNTTQFAYAINVSNPGKVNVVYAAKEKKFIAYQDVNVTVQRSNLITYRKGRINTVPAGSPYYLELLDFKNSLSGKTMTIGGKEMPLTVENRTTPRLITTLTTNPSASIAANKAKFQSDYNLVEGFDYLLTYSDTSASLPLSGGSVDIRSYYEIINPSTDKFPVTVTNQNPPTVVKRINKDSKFYLTAFSPFTLFSFISNVDTRPTTNISHLFTAPQPQLARNKDKYNKNFYYVWRLIESADFADLTYAYGWVDLDGNLIPTRLNYELDADCYLSPAYVFHSANNYDGHMRIDIGGMDRANLVVNRPPLPPQEKIAELYEPSVIFTPTGTTESRTFFGYSTYDALNEVNHAIQRATN